MARREIGTRWDRENRNNINENFKELYDMQDRAIEEATQSIIDSAKLIWLEPVNTFADIATTYPNPEIGHTVFVRDTGKVYRFYNGSWMEIQQIDAGPVNEIDTRLSAEIDENKQEIEQARTKADGTTFPVLRDRLNDVDDKIGILKTLAINVKEFGAKGDGNNDDSTVISNAINEALFSKPDGTTYNVIRVKIPAGRYMIDNTISINMKIPSGVMKDRLCLIIEGDGETSFLALRNAQTLFDIQNATIILRNLSLIGKNNSDVGVQLGRTATNEDGSYNTVYECVFDKVYFYYFENQLVINHAYDCTFRDCGFFGARGNSPVMLTINTHNTDNTNNVLFERCHFEVCGSTTGGTGTMVKIVGSDSNTSRIHNLINFHSCHFETRFYKTKIVDASWVQELNFFACQFTRSNTEGTTYGLTANDVVPMFRLINCPYVNFFGGTAQHIGDTLTTSHNKFFELGGVTNVNVRYVYFVPRNGVNNPNYSVLYQLDSLNPIRNQYGFFNVDDCGIDSHNNKTNKDYLVISDASSSNRKFIINHVNNILNLYYTSNSNYDINDLVSALLKIDSVGTLTPSAFGGKSYLIANNATQEYVFDATNNVSLRGIYLMWGDTPGDCYAIFYSSGTALYQIAVGSIVSISNNETNNAGKFNIYFTPSKKTISIKNLYGSDRKISVAFFGFSA